MENTNAEQQRFNTRVTGIHNVHPVDVGRINVLADLECGGLALLRNLVSVTVGQVVEVFPSQIIGAITEKHVKEAYAKGTEDTLKKVEADNVNVGECDKVVEVEEYVEEQLELPITEETEEK